MPSETPISKQSESSNNPNKEEITGSDIRIKKLLDEMYETEISFSQTLALLSNETPDKTLGLLSNETPDKTLGKNRDTAAQDHNFGKYLSSILSLNSKCAIASINIQKKILEILKSLENDEKLKEALIDLINDLSGDYFDALEAQVLAYNYLLKKNSRLNSDTSNTYVDLFDKNLSLITIDKISTFFSAISITPTQRLPRWQMLWDGILKILPCEKDQFFAEVNQNFQQKFKKKLEDFNKNQDLAVSLFIIDSKPVSGMQETINSLLQELQQHQLYNSFDEEFCNNINTLTLNIGSNNAEWRLAISRLQVIFNNEFFSAGNPEWQFLQAQAGYVYYSNILQEDIKKVKIIDKKLENILKDKITAFGIKSEYKSQWGKIYDIKQYLHAFITLHDKISDNSRDVKFHKEIRKKMPLNLEFEACENWQNQISSLVTKITSLEVETIQPDWRQALKAFFYSDSSYPAQWYVVTYGGLKLFKIIPIKQGGNSLKITIFDDLDLCKADLELHFGVVLACVTQLRKDNATLLSLSAEPGILKLIEDWFGMDNTSYNFYKLNQNQNQNQNLEPLKKSAMKLLMN